MSSLTAFMSDGSPVCVRRTGRPAHDEHHEQARGKGLGAMWEEIPTSSRGPIQSSEYGLPGVYNH